jgi:hypothetical protein
MPAEQFLDVFGKPPRLLTCECERSNDTTMSQAFQLISGPTINSMLSHANNRLTQLLKSGKSDGEMVEELYWAALSRAPHASETERAVSLLEHARSNQKERRLVLEDLAWALLNCKEFVLRQ